VTEIGREGKGRESWTGRDRQRKRETDIKAESRREKETDKERLNETFKGVTQ
jgi:hypothetical protein